MQLVRRLIGDFLPLCLVLFALTAASALCAGNGSEPGRTERDESEPNSSEGIASGKPPQAIGRRATVFLVTGLATESSGPRGSYSGIAGASFNYRILRRVEVEPQYWTSAPGFSYVDARFHVFGCRANFLLYGRNADQRLMPFAGIGVGGIEVVRSSVSTSSDGNQTYLDINFGGGAAYRFDKWQIRGGWFAHRLGSDELLLQAYQLWFGYRF